MVYILGIHDGHNASACLLKDGKIVACAQEERFTRIKNIATFPLYSIEFVLRYAGITSSDLDLVVVASDYGSFGWYKSYNLGILGALYRKVVRDTTVLSTLDIRVRPKKLALLLGDLLSRPVGRIIRRKSLNIIADILGIDRDVVISVDHHLCHAYTAIFSSPFPTRNEDALVFTADGEGDFISSRVYIFKDGVLEKISESPTKDSLGYFYSHVTKYLGMKPLEHEYKVMGLAPYAPEYGVKKVLDKIRDLYYVDGLKIRSRFHAYEILEILIDRLSWMRFDWIAGAAQKLLETILIKWIRNAIQLTKIHNIAVAGGIFMNVKANMKIADLPEVEKMFAMPSAGDESLSIGAAYYGYRLLKPDAKIEPLRDLYLGPEYSDEEIIEEIERFRSDETFEVEYHKDIDDVIAELLIEGKIVARVSGRMEFGARALGNRSILADASDRRIVEIINKAIKKRDFWMPFAPTILGEYADEYLKAPDWKKTNPEYMIFAYESTEKARNDLEAAMHPYDKTLRPQILWRDWNPGYYKILKKFADETGRFGLLNTSYNLHGEPIVCSPRDAIETFLRSGLKYLALGKYLLIKKR